MSEAVDPTVNPEAPPAEPVQLAIDTAPEPEPKPVGVDVQAQIAAAVAEERKRYETRLKAAEKKAREEATAIAKAEAEEQARLATLSEQERTKHELETLRAEREKERQDAARLAEERDAQAKRLEFTDELANSGTKLQADAAIKDLAYQRVAAKVETGLTYADAIKELCAENPWMFQATPTAVQSEPTSTASSGPTASARTVRPQVMPPPRAENAFKWPPAQWNAWKRANGAQ